MPSGVPMRSRSLARVFALLALALPVVATAQQKKVLTQADWDKWKRITSPAISADGKWVAYTVEPLVGDGELVVRSTTGTTEYRVPRGYTDRPNNVPGGLRGAANANPEGEAAGAAATPAQLTADG